MIEAAPRSQVLFLPPSEDECCSDLTRAVTTADAIQATRRRLPHDRDLREINFGDWELKIFSEVEAETPDRLRAFYETPGDISPPNGESWNVFCARSNAAIDRLVADNHAPNLIVVAHFGVVLTQVQRASDVEPHARAWRQEEPHAP